MRVKLPSANPLSTVLTALAVLSPGLAAQCEPHMPPGPPPPPPTPYFGPGDTCPAPSAPSSPAPRNPGNAGSPTSPGMPSGPTGPVGPGSPTRPVSGLGMGADDDSWSVWWEHNRDAYLGLKRAVYRGLPMSGEHATVRLRPSEELIAKSIIPALLMTLDDEPAADTTNACVMALARIGAADEDSKGNSLLQERITSYLSDPAQGVAENACISLGVLGHRTSLPVLTSLLNDGVEARELCGRSISARMRAFAAYGLGIAAAHTPNADMRRYAIHQLLRVLDDDETSTETRVACTIALGVVSPERSSATEQRSARPGAPVASASEELVVALLEHFENRRTDELVRAHAATSLAHHLPNVGAELRERAVKSLLERVTDRRARNEVRQSCALALGRVGDCDEDALDAKVRKDLMDVASSGDKLAGFYARVALAQIGGRAGDGKGDAQAGRDEIRSYLLKKLAKDRSRERAWTALALGVLGAHTELAASDRTALRLMLAEKDSPDVSSAFGVGAALCGDRLAIDPLLARLDDVKEPAARGRFAVALGMLGSTESIEALVDILHDAEHEPELLERTAVGLALAGHKDLVPELIGMTDPLACSYSQVAVARALGRTGDGRAVQPLVAMLQEESTPEIVRAWAASSLGWLADRSELPWPATLSVDLNYRANPPSLTSTDGRGVIDFQ